MMICIRYNQKKRLWKAGEHTAAVAEFTICCAIELSAIMKISNSITLSDIELSQKKMLGKFEKKFRQANEQHHQIDPGDVNLLHACSALFYVTQCWIMMMMLRIEKCMAMTLMAKTGKKVSLSKRFHFQFLILLMCPFCFQFNTFRHVLTKFMWEYAIISSIKVESFPCSQIFFWNNLQSVKEWRTFNKSNKTEKNVKFFSISLAIWKSF